jgi:hypothetical protein
LRSNAFVNPLRRHNLTLTPQASSAGTDEQRLATRLLHDPGMRRSRRVQDSQNFVAAMDQFLQVRRF